MSQINFWPIELRVAAELLSKAMQYAESGACSPWDFAVEIGEFEKLGVGLSDLRYLVQRGLLEHAKELQADSAGNRRFQPTGKLTFARHTCFVLSEQGRQCVSGLIGAEETGKSNGRATVVVPSREELATCKRMKYSELKPDWNSMIRRLALGEIVVKQYRAPAINQHTILSVFQDENWRERIDDPLPQVKEIDPKRRLHEAIAGLNRNQINRVLHFSGDGSGRGVRWTAVVGKPIARACRAGE